MNDAAAAVLGIEPVIGAFCADPAVNALGLIVADAV